MKYINRAIITWNCIIFSPSDRHFNVVVCVYLFVCLTVCSFGYTPNSRHTFVILCVNMCASLSVFSVVCACMLSNAGDIDEFILWCQDGSVVSVLCSFGYHMFDCILAIPNFSVFLSMVTVLWAVILFVYFCTNQIYIYVVSQDHFGESTYSRWLKECLYLY